MPKTSSANCLSLVSHTLFVVMFLKEDVTCSVAFQPSFLVASGPSASAFLVGNVSGISLTISTISPSNVTGSLPPPSCAPSSSVQWTLSQELMGRSGLLVRVSLNRSLQLCGNETECCAQPLCVQETVRVSACRGNTPLASLTVQAEIYALLPSAGHVSGNKTVIPNQVFQPLGRCPCDLSPGECNIRCCCDQDCTPELLMLFAGQCLPGPFGGRVTPAPDYGCSAQSAENAPDWFPFLCVTSPSENNPFLGLFYQGKTVTPKPAPSFQPKQVISSVPPTSYHQGDPIFRTDNQYFTIPQTSGLGQCMDKAPVAFLQDFEATCVSALRACPSPATDLRVAVRDGLGGVVTVSVVDEVVDPSSSLSNPAKQSDLAQVAGKQLCVNVVLALSYTLNWRGNGLSGITVIRRTGNITLNPDVSLTTRYSAVFVNGNVTAQPDSGNPGYQVGRPVIGGFLDSTNSAIGRAPISLWQAVGGGQCSSAGLRPVLYGWNSTSGCVIPVSLLNLTQCSQLRETVQTALAELVPATLVSRTGKPDFSTLTSWTRVTTVVQNSSRPAGVASGVCSGVPTHLHILIRTAIMGTVGGVPQNMIEAVELSLKETTWSVECGTAGSNPCMTPDLMQSFPVTSSVTFTQAPISAETPKTRFRINFTEFDCDRNDVCWPELLFPLTAHYTGEAQSQALAKGLLLVFFFIAASLLGTPWRRIRQAWGSI